MQDFKPDAEKHARAQFPRESAGLIVNDVYFPCRNIADEPRDTFVLEPVDYARAMYFGNIQGVVHSHPDGSPVSDQDRKACTETGLPWFVYSVPDEEWLTIDP
nr:Predicted metal-dependent protease of the PAD1/JAB1 superfamily (COG1310) [uncultured Mediterranean phage uvMED]BAR24812.1 Predicted metal-dependent protease of the PAD1/JAB1 superfamily (COG1310) [uncultured Mediterranean phage uvMED]BAR24831.1 Predicted metal-dependent protease of the PAD1/JAB1 superfamily (COG1310) [uncultured Mediterranean phage uvMED]BAR24891.1 Predicted metal-dependent protease of the PAD1/JAB1 superfamily (COG1310) [uncultured Mediterranean phage uvMED]